MECDLSRTSTPGAGRPQATMAAETDDTAVANGATDAGWLGPFRGNVSTRVVFCLSSSHEEDQVVCTKPSPDKGCSNVCKAITQGNSTILWQWGIAAWGVAVQIRSWMLGVGGVWGFFRLTMDPVSLSRNECCNILVSKLGL